MSGSARPPASQSIRWALRRRCPQCGEKVFDGYFTMRAVCAGCALLTDRGEPDYFLGSVLVNLIIAELVPVGAAVGIIVLTFPDVRWGLVLGTALTLAVIMPVVCYPYAKALWLAVDLRFRPGRFADRRCGTASL